MIEGVWLKKKELSEKQTENFKGYDVNVRLVMYNEEKEWFEREKKNRDR